MAYVFGSVWSPVVTLLVFFSVQTLLPVSMALMGGSGRVAGPVVGGLLVRGLDVALKNYLHLTVPALAVLWPHPAWNRASPARRGAELCPTAGMERPVAVSPPQRVAPGNRTCPDRRFSVCGVGRRAHPVPLGPPRAGPADLSAGTHLTVEPRGRVRPVVVLGPPPHHRHPRAPRGVDEGKEARDGALHVREIECVVVKHRYSAFVGSRLPVVLRALGGPTLLLAGVTTNVCVESTARDGFMRDFMVRSEGHIKSEPTATYYRVAPDGAYLGWTQDGRWREDRLLAFPPDVGRVWPYDDGRPSRLRIAQVTAVPTPAGSFQGCLQVVREFLVKEQAEQFTQETYYCPDVGEVKEVFLQRRRGRTSENLKILVSTRAGGGR